MADVSSIIEYYVNLLIIQYNQKPNARATIRAIIEQLQANGIFFDVQAAYSVETAVGAQLDVLGKYVGIDRFYEGQVLSGFFGFITYDEVDAPPPDRIGFADYSDFDTKPGRWLLYTDVISGTLVLGDEDYRFLMKLKIIQNNSNHSHQSIDESVYAFFGNTVYPDSLGNMEMTYFLQAGYGPLIEVALQKQVLPRPMAVGLRHVIIQRTTFFGFATYSGFSPLITGFANYADYDTKEGESLTYDKIITP